ncbi:related to ATP-dependent RNA helicase MAK5 [Cephalotrichum gorgonifer]|uniref:Related to ATP-dependent RNA helicase MAK5 n=1 Tax=Cephalotrichum gorgonifer TaxID=2041049 RepID=A0AAE8N3J1_9PEZI|nr:related to ATP-dependent RNA helicase MAK5 [Cephalotrichum gorgonifer]
MEPTSKKRKLQGGPSDNKKPGKRTKTGGKPGATKAKKVRSTAGFRKLDGGSLPWKDDGDMMGLEVLEGVDIVRNGDNVEFLVPPGFAESAGVEEKKEGEDEEEEFEGFDDAPVAQGEAVKAAEPKATKAPKSKAAKAVETKAAEATVADEEDEEEEGVASPEEEDSSDDDDEDGSVPLSNEIPDTDMTAWEPLNLSHAMEDALARLKFSKPTLIQAAAIPEALEGHDVIGKASTGSGKTLAFAIPIIERWLKDRADTDTDADKVSDVKIPTALILSPTRELAKQLTDHIKALCAGLKVSPYVCSVTGGLSILKQERQLAKADIVIATPGRLWEVISGDIPLLKAFKEIKFLVVDEADRLLSEGNFKEAEDILNALDREEMGFDGEDDEEDESDDEDEELAPRQTLVFSATFDKSLQRKLAGKGKSKLTADQLSMEYLLKKLRFREENPKFVDVNPVSQMAEKLREGLVECDGLEKDLYLYAVLMLNPVQKTLVFANSILSVRRLAPLLQNLQLKVHALHSQMPQKARLRSIERFAAANPKEPTILVSTDVAARGLDIPNVDQVIHYHVPRAADAYVHRSGRTARADKSGLSVLLCAPEEVVSTRRLVAKVHSEKSAGPKHAMRTIDVDRKVVSRLKPRVTLAKEIADAAIAKDRGAKEDNWMKKAAEDLGVDYDSDEMESAKSWSGKGSGKKKKEREIAQLSKQELGVMRARLREMLEKKVNTGVSERYITGGRVDVEALLRDEGKDNFLGHVDGGFL